MAKKQKTWLDAWDTENSYQSEEQWPSSASPSAFGLGGGNAPTLPQTAPTAPPHATHQPTYKRCAASHPPLDVGGGKVIYGGSCIEPVVKDASVYIGFDSGMRMGIAHPWNGKCEVLFKITDQAPPANHEEFEKLVKWTSTMIDKGHKVHAGCIGGHGRTGTFFAALVAYRKAAEDPIAHVRGTYCTKAVESYSQVDYLMEKWGCKKALPRHAKAAAQVDSYTSKPTINGNDPWNTKKKKHQPHSAPSDNMFDSGKPLRVQGCIWSGRVNPS